MSADLACGSARAWLSAFRDGEALPDPDARAHLDACAACGAWEGALDAVTRRLVLRAAGGPDVTGPALAAWRAEAGAPAPAQRRIARAMLAVAGLAGLALSAASLPGTVAPAGSHFLRDLVAFEAALAVGFLLSAWRPDRYPRGLVPVAGIAGTLTLVAAAPAMGGGTAELIAEASHLTVLLGLFGLFVLLDAMNTTGPRRRRIA